MDFSVLDRMTVRAKLWVLAGGLMGVAVLLWVVAFWPKFIVKR